MPAASRLWRCLAAVGLIVAASAAPVSAASKLLHTTDYRSHPVSGTTAAAVLHSMNANPIIDPDDGPAYANLTHDHDVVIRTAMTGGTCRVTDLTFRWHFVLTLPEAADYGRMGPAMQKTWSDFRASLKKHEEGHRTIFLGCGKAFVAAAAKLTAPGGCGGLERTVRRYLDKQYAACMAKQREYETLDRPRVMASPFIRAALAR